MHGLGRYPVDAYELTCGRFHVANEQDAQTELPRGARVGAQFHGRGKAGASYLDLSGVPAPSAGRR